MDLLFKRLIIASDQMGVYLKLFIIERINELGLSIVDGGTFDPDKIVDYPDYIRPAAHAVADGTYDGGIVICGTGLGASIAANKVPGIRCVLCNDIYSAHQGRAHNNANILALGAWIVTPQRVIGIVEEWLRTPFEGGRHIPRLAKLDLDFSTTLTDNRDAQKIDWKGSGVGMALTIEPSSFGPVLFGGNFETGLQVIAEADFDHIELSVRNPEDINQILLSEMLEKYNLSISALATGQGCVMDGLCLAAKDEQKRLAAVRRIKKIIDLAIFFNVPVIIGGVRGRLTDNDAERDDHRYITIKTIDECVKYAAEKGIVILLEPINRYETNFINTLSEGIELIEYIKEPSFKLLPDTFHMNIEEANIPNSLDTAKEYIGYIHFADSNRLAPGMGHIDFRQILSKLRDNKYNGRITAEILPIPDNESAVKKTASFLFSLIGNAIGKTNGGEQRNDG